MRNLVDAVLKVIKHVPNKNEMERLALHIVQKYPDLFQDSFSGVVCGLSDNTLTAALYDRSKYIIRKNLLMSGKKFAETKSVICCMDAKMKNVY